MRTPLVYTASEIATWHVSEEFAPGKWRPARPCAFWGFRYSIMRFRIAWNVFTGRYDALNWQGTGEKKVTETHYRDILHPEFQRAT